MTYQKLVEDFTTEARDITDSMIANAQRYGIIDSDPWGEESLNSVASKFFAEENFTKESLAIFFGEGLVRVHGGPWKIMAGERTENLQISLVFYVDFGEKGGTFPYGTINYFSDSQDPTGLKRLFDISV